MANNNNDGVKSSSLGSISEVEKLFKKFDANGDGKITKPELKAVFESLGTHAPTEDLDAMMTEMDSNGDGAVDLAEFAAFYGGAPAGLDEVKDAFAVYDKDGDGKITARELHAVMCGLGEVCTVEDCVGMIESVDLDGDGCVGFEEFKRMMRL